MLAYVYGIGDKKILHRVQPISKT